MIVLPEKYIRKMYRDNFNGIVSIYDSLPPNNATPPYAVITSIALSPKPARGATELFATVTMSIHDEFLENGGMLRLDNLTQQILNLLVPANSIYLSIENFNHVICKIINVFNDTIDISAVTVYRNTIQIEHLVSQQ